ncbi:MAG: chloride channel protein [Alphaproteobacteria bacterium]
MTASPPHAMGLLRLSLVAILVGAITGVGAIVFRILIGFVHNLMFLGQASVDYDATVYTPESPWGVFVILVPVIGAIGVTFLVKTFAPEARGHGVPEVIDAIYYKEGRIRPIVAAVKSLASALAIGSGSSVGREGPIIQIGASLGSTIGQVLPMAAWQRITLVAAGAGAGIAATFNTPIGGVMFAIELMMPEVSVRTFLPVALATGTATYVSRLFLGLAPAFQVPTLALSSGHVTSVETLLLYAVLGVLAGATSAAFVRGLRVFEDAFERIPNPYLRHVSGMLVVGLLMYLLFLSTGHYHVESVGYSTVEDILGGGLALPGLLAILLAAKLLATLLSLGSGSSGGVFSPSLFLGATLGAAFGGVCGMVAPALGLSLPAFAVVGMAAVVGGSTAAAMTAVTMIFEMTRDYGIVMPMIIAVAISIGIRRLLSRETIYTMKLEGRRHFIPQALHANMFLVRHAADVMDRDVLILPAGTPLEAVLKDSPSAGTLRHIVATADGRIVGAVRINADLHGTLKASKAGTTLGEVATANIVTVGEQDVMFDVIGRMSKTGAGMAVVVRSAESGAPSGILGVITKEHVADSVADSIRPYAETDPST